MPSLGNLSISLSSIPISSSTCSKPLSVTDNSPIFSKLIFSIYFKLNVLYITISQKCSIVICFKRKKSADVNRAFYRDLPERPARRNQNGISQSRHSHCQHRPPARGFPAGYHEPGLKHHRSP